VAEVSEGLPLSERQPFSIIPNGSVFHPAGTCSSGAVGRPKTASAFVW